MSILKLTVLSVVLLAGHASANDREFKRNMEEANKGYKHMQEQRQAEKMKEYQKNAGNHVQGPTEAKVAPNTYVKPSYNNGAFGGTVTIETK